MTSCQGEKESPTNNVSCHYSYDCHRPGGASGGGGGSDSSAVMVAEVAVATASAARQSTGWLRGWPLCSRPGSARPGPCGRGLARLSSARHVPSGCWPSSRRPRERLPPPHSTPPRLVSADDALLVAFLRRYAKPRFKLCLAAAFISVVSRCDRRPRVRCFASEPLSRVVSERRRRCPGT